MKNYTITVNGNVDVTVEESGADRLQHPRPHLKALRKQRPRLPQSSFDSEQVQREA